MEEKYEALLLRATDYRENDKIITLFAAGKGKITAVCRGVRKAAAKLKFAVQPFCFAEYVLAERAGRHTVVSAFLHDGFYPLREDVLKLYAASAVTEACDGLLPEGMESDSLFFAALSALREICENEPTMPLIKFLLLALSEAGYSVDTGACLDCGGEIGAGAYFDFERGGFCCADCPHGARVSEVTYHILADAAGESGGSGTAEFSREDLADGRKRALRLLKTYFVEKTESRAECLSEFIRMI